MGRRVGGAHRDRNASTSLNPPRVMAQTRIMHSDPEVRPGAASPERLLRKLEGTARVEDAIEAGALQSGPERNQRGIREASCLLTLSWATAAGQAMDKAVTRARLAVPCPAGRRLCLRTLVPRGQSRCYRVADLGSLNTMAVFFWKHFTLLKLK